MKTIRHKHPRVNTVGVRQHTMEIAAAKPATGAKPKRATKAKAVKPAPSALPAGGTLVKGPVAKRHLIPSTRMKPQPIAFDRTQRKAIAGHAKAGAKYLAHHEAGLAEHRGIVDELKSKKKLSQADKKKLASSRGKVLHHSNSLSEKNEIANGHRKAIADHAFISKALKTNSGIIGKDKRTGARKDQYTNQIKVQNATPKKPKEASAYGAARAAEKHLGKVKRDSSFSIKKAEAEHGEAKKTWNEAHSAHAKHSKAHGKLLMKKKVDPKVLKESERTLKKLDTVRSKAFNKHEKTLANVAKAKAPVEAAKTAVHHARAAEQLDSNYVHNSHSWMATRSQRDKAEGIPNTGRAGTAGYVKSVGRANKPEFRKALHERLTEASDRHLEKKDRASKQKTWKSKQVKREAKKASTPTPESSS